MVYMPPYMAAPTREMLPMINPPDHALYLICLANMGDGGSQYAAAETSGTPQPTVRTAGAPARTFQRGAFLDY